MIPIDINKPIEAIPNTIIYSTYYRPPKNQCFTCSYKKYITSGNVQCGRHDNCVYDNIHVAS